MTNLYNFCCSKCLLAIFPDKQFNWHSDGFMCKKTGGMLYKDPDSYTNCVDFISEEDRIENKPW